MIHDSPDCTIPDIKHSIDDSCCSCILGGEEPLSAVIMGGRHPGQYFLSGGESLDYLITTTVCNTLVDPEELQLSVSRAGAMTDMLEEEVLLCGGRDTEGRVRDDCLAYNFSSNSWSDHSLMLSAREEAGGEADSSDDQSQSSLGLTSSERALSLSQQSLHVQNTPLLLHLSPLDITMIRIQK